MGGKLEAARLVIEAKDIRIRELEEQLQGAKTAEVQAEEEAKQVPADGMTQQQWKNIPLARIKRSWSWRNCCRLPRMVRKPPSEGNSDVGTKMVTAALVVASLLLS